MHKLQKGDIENSGGFTSRDIACRTKMVCNGRLSAMYLTLCMAVKVNWVMASDIRESESK